jgi:hypothetical protein
MWPDLKCCPSICLEQQKIATKILQIVDTLAEISAMHLLNNIQKNYLHKFYKWSVVMG